MSATSIFFHLQSFLILCVLGLGVVLRKRRRLHVPLMSVGMGWDVILIVQIEIFRDALFKASRFMGNPGLLNVHVILATTTLVFYGFCIYTGRGLLAGRSSVRTRHRRAGMCAITFRVLTFITGLLNTLVS